MIIEKASARLNGIRRIGHIISRKARVTLYQSLVLSILEYGSILYDNCTFVLKQRLESLQRRAAVICTRAFITTSYDKLKTELGWNSLEERRTLARRSLFYKMTHKLVPKYLSDLVPQTVGARVGCYVLRNSGDLVTERYKKTLMYTSFIPKTIRDWNSNVSNWRALVDWAPSLETFKLRYKKLFSRMTNSLYNIEIEEGNKHHTRMRLGLSHLRSHLYYYGLINDPICQFCNIEPETVDHYVLRCPSFHAARVNYLTGLLANLDGGFLNNLNDSMKIDLFLHGNSELDNDTNVILIEMALTFINTSKRFDMRLVQ